MNSKDIAQTVEKYRIEPPACHHDWRHRDGDWFFCSKCLAHAIIRSRRDPSKDNWIITVELQQMERC
jgi:hypothetical protein